MVDVEFVIMYVVMIVAIGLQITVVIMAISVLRSLLRKSNSRPPFRRFRRSPPKSNS